MVQYESMDASSGALADPTRRGILELLGCGPATVSELAQDFSMTLTGIKKHPVARGRGHGVTGNRAGSGTARSGPMFSD
nr:helix-turn-helix domain-containing protein [Nocardia grenadensis]